MLWVMILPKAYPTLTLSQMPSAQFNMMLLLIGPETTLHVPFCDCRKIGSENYHVRTMITLMSQETSHVSVS